MKPDITERIAVAAAALWFAASAQVEGERASGFSKQLLGVSRQYTDQVKPNSPAAAKDKQEKQQQKQQPKQQKKQQRQQPQKEKKRKNEQSNRSFKREM